MDLNLDLNLVQSQKVLLTPRLKQALEVLRMDSQELFEYVEEQLESNPFLDVLEHGYNTKEMAINKHYKKKVREYQGEIPEEELDPQAELEEMSYYYSLSDSVQFIIPDIIIKKVHEQFQVVLNEDAIPMVNLNEVNGTTLNFKANTEVQKYIRKKMEAAKWMVWCIEQRKNALLKITEHILKKEAEFFEKGKKFLKPLTLRELAEELEIHETVIQNTLSGKYLQCQWGVFETNSFIKIS